MQIRIKSLIFFNSDKRTNKVRKNIVGLGVLQAVNMFISFLLVPMVMDFVSPSQYGIWLTMSSMVSWLSLLDVGLGTGMKNKLTEALSKGDIKLAKELVSTTYVLIGFIILVAGGLFCIISLFVDWSVVYNQETEMNALLFHTTLVVVSCYLLKLVVGLVGTVLTSYLKPALNQLLNTISNLLVIIVIWILTKCTNGNILLLSSILSTSSVVVFFIASIVLYKGKYRSVSPSIKCFRRKHISSVLGLGVSFFFINISMTILYQINNFIIIHKFNNEDVVVYNLAYKLFAVCQILFGLISQPFWTAYTDAWAKNDVKWIRDTLSRVKKLWVCLIVFGVSLVVASPMIYKIWVGDRVSIPIELSIMIFVYFVGNTYGGVYNTFINGVGKVRLQMVCLVIIAILYIPIVLVFVDVLNLGIISIPLAQLCSNFYSLFIARIQCNKILDGTAVGIWNK